MFKTYDEPESLHEGECIRYDEPESPNEGSALEIYDEPELPNEGARGRV